MSDNKPVPLSKNSVPVPLNKRYSDRSSADSFYVRSMWVEIVEGNSSCNGMRIPVDRKNKPWLELRVQLINRKELYGDLGGPAEAVRVIGSEALLENIPFKDIKNFLEGRDYLVTEKEG